MTQEDGSFNYCNNHESDGNDDEYIMENRDKEKNFSYLWQKEKELMGDREEEELIIIQKKNKISTAEGT